MITTRRIDGIASTLGAPSSDATKREECCTGFLVFFGNEVEEKVRKGELVKWTKKDRE
jgi:hypothetical protein